MLVMRQCTKEDLHTDCIFQSGDLCNKSTKNIPLRSQFRNTLQMPFSMLCIYLFHLKKLYETKNEETNLAIAAARCSLRVGLFICGVNYVLLSDWATTTMKYPFVILNGK